jgi:hypothetical protein
LIILGAALLVLLALAPLASARYADAPPRQATATVEPTNTATPDSTLVGTPSTLPETGGGENATAWIPVLIVAIAVTLLLLGMGLVAGSHPRPE